MTLNVLASNADGVELDTGVSQCQLSPMVAANVTVQPLPDEAADQLCVRRLSALASGEQAS